MQTFHYALQDLAVVDGKVLDQDGQPFDREAYSRFKYGYIPPAMAYGKALAMLVVQQLFALAGKEPIIIVSAPYKYLPTASHAIAYYLRQELSQLAVLFEREPPVLVPFHKARTGSSSYARSSEAERLKSLATLGLHIDESLVPGSHVLVVDDIRITGSAERASASYLEGLGPASVWYLHAARLPEDLGRSHPGLEDELNQSVAHCLEGFLQEVSAGEFKLNTRVLRFILETPDQESFIAFLNAAPLSLLEQILDSGVGSGLKYFDRYRHNLMLVSEAFWRRSGPTRTLASAATAR